MIQNSFKNIFKINFIKLQIKRCFKFQMPVINSVSFPYFGRYMYFKSTNCSQKYNVNVPFLISIVNVA